MTGGVFNIHGGFGAFLPKGTPTRAECVSWLFWEMGSAPYLGGGFGHFYAWPSTDLYGSPCSTTTFLQMTKPTGLRLRRL